MLCEKVALRYGLEFCGETFEGNRKVEHSVCVSVDIFTLQLSVPGWEGGSCPYLRPPNYPFALMFQPPINYSIFALDKGGASADTENNSTFRLGSSGR